MTGVVSGKGHLTGCGLLGTVLFLFSQSGFKCFSFYVAHGLNIKCLDSGGSETNLVIFSMKPFILTRFL